MSTAELVLAVLAVAVGGGLLYALACRIWPFAACRRCTGSGKRRSPGGKAWRDCGRCKGTGKRLRVGWRLVNNAKKNRHHL
ncbi:hypothetical protein [Microlunatus speluncae]|uniref:hypothetical protein n=1 Tax=Microlunatus speluncae TaxID=2594267 RepID=UPI0012663885|nr:hypothetical protein [Microlunatus speluncae]